MKIPEKLQPLIEKQRGIVNRRQCLAAGMKTSEIRWAVGRTAQMVLPGVLALFTGELDDGQKLIAAQLWAGDEAMLASFTAVRWHSVGDVPDDGLIRVLVGPRQAARQTGFVIARRTYRPDPNPWFRDPITVCSRARALVDAARELRTTDRARALLIQAVQRGHVRERDLWSELDAGPVNGSAGVREAMRQVGTGAWSPPEFDVLSAMSKSRILPRVWANPKLVTADGMALPSPDGWIDEVALAIQVQSRQYHLRDADWEGTVATGTVFAEYLVPVLAVTPAQIAADVQSFVRRVEQTYLRLQRSGTRPAVRMVMRGRGVVSA
jgi:hypothetical protein